MVLSLFNFCQCWALNPSLPHAKRALPTEPPTLVPSTAYTLTPHTSSHAWRKGTEILRQAWMHLWHWEHVQRLEQIYRSNVCLVYLTLHPPVKLLLCAVLRPQQLVSMHHTGTWLTATEFPPHKGTGTEFNVNWSMSCDYSEILFLGSCVTKWRV